MRLLLCACVLYMLLIPTQHAGARVGCQAQLVGQAVPEVLSHTITTQAKAATRLNIRQLCFHDFTVGYAPTFRTPIWSAEYLTRKRLEQARQLPREDFFHEETRLTSYARTYLDDYKASGFDRGHLAPNYDMATPESQYDSFSLANIIPQVRQHNRYIWSDIERLTRYQVYKHGEAYVLTGAAFLHKDALPSGIPIPSHLYKVVYLPSLKKAGVYWSEHTADAQVDVISLTELENRAHVIAMPSLPKSVRDHALDLPVDRDNPNASVSKSNDAAPKVNIWRKFGQFFNELWAWVKQLFV